ncbi:MULTISPECIES: hypothetical protein [unclassified Halomonas]|uniref:hypothetical protein n=1 Tax=unclassified Halomonas TaxID=2609666 RepID=UPI001CF5358B|nr:MULTISPECIES: hypothetical protein [unclassified Halomonas]MCA8865307.1 hypothetical protein [Halomonas sp. SBBP1]UZH12270.1 hypothetical protein OM794_11275 [Halomonas sp. BDJS001]
MPDNNWREKVLKSTGVFEEHETDLALMKLLVLDNKPEYFYRYRSGRDYDLNALKDGCEYLSYPNDYNDPFDAHIFIDKEVAIIPALNKRINEKMTPEFRQVVKYLTGHDKLDIFGDRADRQLLKKARKKLVLEHLHYKNPVIIFLKNVKF